MEQKDQNKEATSSLAANRMEGYKNKNSNDLPIDAIKTDTLDLLSKMMSQNKDGIIDPDSNLFNKALSVLMGKKQGAGFVKGGHPKFFLAKPGNNIILNSDTMVHNYVTPIEKLSKDQINYLTQNNTPIVSIGTQLSSAEGSCMLAGYLTSKFFTKNKGEMLDSLNNFINKELNKELNKHSSYVCKETSSGDGGVQRSSDWRNDGKFMARIAWPYNDNGVIRWKDHKAIDLLEWEPVVDYIKDTQSLKFIKRFIERYKTKFQKEPVIGKLKVSLRDYVDFFTTEHNDDDKWCKPQNNGPKKRSNAASAMTRISLSRNGHGDACLDENCYDKNFNFDGLLARIIQNNQLNINVDDLKRILKQEHKAEDAPTQMFVLAQESEELLKSINNFKSKKTESQIQESHVVSGVKNLQDKINKAIANHLGKKKTLYWNRDGKDKKLMNTRFFLKENAGYINKINRKWDELLDSKGMSYTEKLQNLQSFVEKLNEKETRGCCPF